MRTLTLSVLVAMAMIAAFFPLTADAHQPGMSYLWLQVNEDGLRGRIDMAVADLNSVTGLNISEEEGLGAEQRQVIADYLQAHYSIGDEAGDYPITYVDYNFFPDFENVLEIFYEVDAPLPVADRLEISYSAIMHQDAAHRGGFHFENNYKIGLEGNYYKKAFIFGPGRETTSFNLLGDTRFQQFVNFAREGVIHIWIGLDHVLFLVTLLLTSVLVRKDGIWQPTEGLRSAMWNVVAVVTVFTVAHSITLGMALKGWIELPSRLIESVIALSILIVVLDNFYSFLGRYKWSAVFVFGLFHGLGFATVLNLLSLDFQSKLLALVGFNLGVEAGQLAIVLVLFPLLFLLRNYNYPKLFLRPASAAIGVVACWWLVERTLDLQSGWTSF